ncbi:2-polyprenyl-6-methoxyphenol hydroxylase-like FAD-dependent oxidoreductase [Prauserella sediminis]|uniref:2-polyprenyl-6-methoxyphenol hydroxylase-like FAD-dependent oxidoreductase n=1 Tax=Prauserella sediminis TaxID=577680 RepID=A0A839XDF0_9PSEU|nr:FAD-dependent oxidoreductase [Prauserella sediminis]MBB3661300.1 2-polyprenyl-6-methoxyphenol hydroxylase-like FAD-dependent oxidoreductase [Prauserella sediminis]
MRTEESVPVLVVGAGLAGASAAMFLGLHGIPALVVERHPATSNQPKARGQSWHTMEALRIAGVAERVSEAGYDLSVGMPIVIAESVAGRTLHEIVGEQPPDWSHLTPVTMAMASQEKVEPILLDRARELGTQVRFGTEVLRLDQDGDGVRARVRDSSGEYTVAAQYVVAADGWRSPIRQALGVGTHGRGALGHSVMVQFRAELDELVQGRDFALFYLQGNPGGNVFVSTDEPGRWVMGFDYDPDTGDRPESYTDAELVDRVRAVVGVDDLDVTIVDRVGTGLAHRVADTFTAGRVHLVGDAAHTMPPHGGQGGNTAVMDGFYLAWKLAAVLQGWAGPGLLDSHDTERRPYGDLIAGQQYANMIVRSAPDKADGTEDPLVPPEQQLLGYRCPGGAIAAEPADDGGLLEDPAQPTGRPGSHAPHVWLRDGVPALDVFGRGFVLLTASPAWAEAAERVADDLAVPLRAQLLDEGEWLTAYGIGAAGASLVRPDRFIAWRATGVGSAAELSAALCTVLSRDDGGSVRSSGPGGTRTHTG